ncbi:MAG: hypothetical protein GF334_01710 [Candidatus Altiarchaeales archaeon]|nr:hypothetical protein [Candidatus Altiarchaeales archaeon]
MDSDSVINPFDMMGMDFTDKLASLHSLMHTIIEDISPSQRSLLDDAFRKIYYDAGITEEKSTWKRTPPTFSELYSAVKAKETDDNQFTPRIPVTAEMHSLKQSPILKR